MGNLIKVLVFVIIIWVYKVQHFLMSIPSGVIRRAIALSEYNNITNQCRYPEEHVLHVG